MKKALNGYTITYLVDIILTLICIILLGNYYHSMSIGQKTFGYLVGIFQFDLAQIWLIIFLFILLSVSLFALLTYFCITIKQSRKNQLEKSAKLGVVIVPIIFVLLLPIVTGISVALTPSETFDNDWLCSDAKFEEWKKTDPTNSLFEYYFQKNVFGKVIDLDHSVHLSSKNNEIMRRGFQCSFRKSNYPNIFSKFSIRKPYTLDERYKILEDNDKYTLYYYSEEDFYSYYLVIESNNTYYYSGYDSNGADVTSEYSADEFIADALHNYNCWNEE